MTCNWRISLAVVSLSVVLGAALPAGAVVTHFNDGAIHDVTGAFTDLVSVKDGGTPSQGTTVNMLAGSSIVTSTSPAFEIAGHSTANFFPGSSVFIPGTGFEQSVSANGASTVNLFGGTLNAPGGVIAMSNATINMYGGTIIARHTEGVTAIQDAVINLYGGEIDGTQAALEANVPSARINLFGGIVFGNSRRFNAFVGGSIYIYGTDFRVAGTPVPYGLVTLNSPDDYQHNQLTGTLSDGKSLNVLLFGGDFVLVPMAPAPEPATALLSGVALAGLGVQMLRRRG